MEDLLAPIIDIKFDIENHLDEQVGALPLPFPGMDKSGSATCVFHIRGVCHRSSMCPYRHIKPDRTVVCKHWLRGLCKKGDSCEFLHEYDMSKMPECYFYSKFRACSNKECPFLHIDPETKVKDCPWYDRGFCRHGPNCRHRHTRRVACINYICGFCPEGPNCKFVHMRFDIPINNPTNPQDQTVMKKATVICHYCNEVGHKIYTCNQIPPDQKDEVHQKYTSEQQNNYLNNNENRMQSFHHNNSGDGNSGPPSSHFHHRHGHHHHNTNQMMNNTNNNTSDQSQTNQSNNNQGPSKLQPTYRPLDQVTCFKCGEKGHYANKCPKGYLAFLSPALKDLHQKRNMNNNNTNNNQQQQNESDS